MAKTTEEITDLYRRLNGHKPDRRTLSALVEVLHPGEDVRWVCAWCDGRKKWGEAMWAAVTDERIIWYRSGTKPKWVAMALAEVVNYREETRKEMLVFTFHDLVVVSSDGQRYQWVDMGKENLAAALKAISDARTAYHATSRAS